MDLLINHLAFGPCDFLGYIGVGLLKVLRDGFSLRVIFEFGEYIFGQVFEILFDNILCLDIFIDIKVFVPVILDDMKLNDHVIWMWAAVFQTNEIGIWLNVSHFSLGWCVDEGKAVREVSEDFGAVIGEILEWEGLAIEVGLGVVAEFEDHGIWGGGRWENEFNFIIKEQTAIGYKLRFRE